MRFFILYTSVLLSFCFSNKPDCDKLPCGRYSVHFTSGFYEDYQLKLIDSNFVQYFKNGDSAYGKTRWLYGGCEFRMEYINTGKPDYRHRILNLMNDSWGEPFTELGVANEDTIRFRTTFPANLHITSSTGYFLKLPNNEK
jgi:hypothetical protein